MFNGSLPLALISVSLNIRGAAYYLQQKWIIRIFFSELFQRLAATSSDICNEFVEKFCTVSKYNSFVLISNLPQVALPSFHQILYFSVFFCAAFIHFVSLFSSSFQTFSGDLTILGTKSEPFSISYPAPTSYQGNADERVEDGIGSGKIEFFLCCNWFNAYS